MPGAPTNDANSADGGLALGSRPFRLSKPSSHAVITDTATTRFCASAASISSLERADIGCLPAIQITAQVSSNSLFVIDLSPFRIGRLGVVDIG